MQMCAYKTTTHNERYISAKRSQLMVVHINVVAFTIFPRSSSRLVQGDAEGQNGGAHR